MKHGEAIRTVITCEVLFIQIVYIGHLLGGNAMEILGALVLAGTIVFIIMIVLAVPTKVKKKKAKAKPKTKRKAK